MKLGAALPAALALLLGLSSPEALAFPEFRAKDLNGREISSRELRGQTALYLIGFSYGSRAEVEAWARALPELLKRTKVEAPPRIIQMPVLSGAGVWARPFIESGLGRNTPKAERPNVMTSTDREALVKGLAIKDPDREAVIVLVDAAGEVRLLLRGQPSEAKERELAAALKAIE